MRYLLDTCALLYCALGTADLSEPTRAALNAAVRGDVFVSAVSLAEIACAVERGRLALRPHWRQWWHEVLKRAAWVCLPITDEVLAEAYSLLPPFHRDPADRVLIATARIERLTLVTTDGKILSYPHVASVR